MILIPMLCMQMDNRAWNKVQKSHEGKKILEEWQV